MTRKRGAVDDERFGLFKQDASLLPKAEQIRILKGNIKEADLRQDQILAKVNDYRQYLASERITYAEYEWLLNHYLRGKSLNEWLFYYENYKLQAGIAIGELEEICREEKAGIRKEKAHEMPRHAPLEKKVGAGMNAAYLIPLFVIFALLGTYFMGNAITGFMTVEFPLNESWDIGSSFARVSMLEYSEDRPLAEFVNGSIVSVDLDSFAIPLSGTLYVDLIINGSLADSRRIEYSLENITEMPNATYQEPNTTYYEPITPLENITETPLENITEIPVEENITEIVNITEPLNITELLNFTLPENMTDATIEFNLSELNLTHLFNDEAVGGIRTGEPVLWQRKIIGGEREAEAFYKEAGNIVLVKKADVSGAMAGGLQADSNKRQAQGGKGREGGGAIGAFGEEAERLKKEEAKDAIEKKGKKLKKEDAGNESYARIGEQEAGEEYYLFYETPAPLMETKEETGEKITVAVSAALDYNNVTVSYPLLTYKARQLQVYWLVNDTKIKIDSHGEDTNADGADDNLLWVAPHLSNQTFELEINVINVYSYPAQGENWTVYFNTTGAGNLSIEPFNDLLDGPWEEIKQDNASTANEMKFMELYCGEERVTDDALVVTNESQRRHGDIGESESIASKKLLLSNYTCNGKTSSIINNMNTPGYISLNFTFATDFGSVSSYAYDPPPPSPMSINLTSPLDNWYVNNTIKFECVAANSTGIVNVSLWHNNTGAWHRNATILSTGSSVIAHFMNSTFATNNFIWGCSVGTTSGEEFFTDVNRTLFVDITAPLIDFVDPTPANATKRATNYNNAYVNVSITEASNNYSAFIDWNRSLVGWWRLKDTNGTWFRDDSSWGNNGTCSGTACPNLTTGMRGEAYTFDGLGDYILIEDANEFDTTNALTIEAWVKTKSLNTVQGIVAKTATIWGNVTFAARINVLQYEFVTSDNGTDINTLATGSIVDTNWHHLVFWLNGSIKKIYVDGQERASSAWNYNLYTNTQNVSIGIYAWAYPQYNMNGSIDEVKIWNRILSPEEINASFSAGVWKLYRNFTSLSSGTYPYKAYVVDQAGNLNNTEQRTFIVNSVPVISSVVLNSTLGTNLTTENLTAYVTSSENDSDGYTLIYDWRKNGISDAVLNMPFDINGSNGNTSNVKDYSSFSRNGTHNGSLSEMPRWNASCGIFAGSGGCYEFDGINDSIKILSNLSLRTTGITISLWAYIKSASEKGSFIKIGTTGGYALGIGGSNFENTGNDLIGLFENVRWIDTNTAIGTGWQFVAMSLNSSGTPFMYLNGTLINSYSGTNANSPQAETDIGGYVIGASPRFFNGSIDSVMVWNRTLSSAEIAMLYNKGIGMYNRTHSDATSNGDIWYAVVTPADIYEDGAPVASNNVTILNSPPTHSTPTINTTLGLNGTNENITAFNVSTADADGDAVRNIWTWYKNGVSLPLINMPFESNNSAGNNATRDYSGYINNGTSISGARWNATGGYNGKGAYYFSNNYLQLNWSIALNNNFTILFWEKLDASISNDDAPVGSTTDSINHFGGTIRVYADGSDRITSTGATSANTWVHYAFVRNGTGVAIYKDGAIQTSNAAGSGWTLDISFVGRGDAGGGMDGYVDELLIFNETLSAEQIKIIYNNATNVISSYKTESGEIWYACLTPNDGFGDGSILCTENLTINTPATASSVYISPSSPDTTYDLNCTFNITDPNPDALFANISWYNNSVLSVAYTMSVVNGTQYSNVLESENTTKGETWTCSIRGYDSHEYGVSSNASIIVGSVPPTHSTPAINTTSGNNLTTENITAFNVSTADADNDPVENIWNWKLNGSSYSMFHFRFLSNNSAGNNATRDYSGNSHNATMYGGATFNATGGFDGKGAFEFDGSNDFFNLSNARALPSGAAARTMCAWAKTNSVAAGYRWIASYGTATTSQAFYLGRESATLYFGGYANDITISNFWSAGKWQHVCAVYNGTTGLIYQNGTFVYSQVKTWSTVPSKAYIGRQVNDAEYWGGTISEVLLFNMTLSAEQINALYRNESNRILSQETGEGSTWQACLTPNDGSVDGDTKCSINLTIQAGCTAPSDNLTISSSTTLCAGTYYVTDAAADGVLLPNSNAGITIQCNRTIIIGNGTGYGIYGSNDHNITLKGCDIRNYTNGVFAATAINWTVRNNNFTVPSGNSYAFYFYNGSANTISYNNITSVGNNSVGEVYISKINQSLIANNNIKAGGTGRGIYIDTDSLHNNLTGNVIETNGSNVQGIFIAPRSINITIKLNNITINGSSSAGIRTEANSSYIANNNITTLGQSSSGIDLAASDNTTIYKNYIYANGSSSYGVYYSTSAIGANLTLNNITATANAVYSHSQWDVYGNILSVLGTGNVINAAGSSSRFWMNNIESIGGVTGGSNDDFCITYDGIEEGSFYASGTTAIPSDDCGAANMTYPDGGEAFNATYINVTWKKQSHSPLKALWYSFAFSNDSAVKWQELSSLWGHQNKFNFSINATYKRFRWQSAPEVKNGTYVTIPKIANITRAIFTAEGTANSVFRNITHYTGNSTYIRQYELYGNASADELGHGIAVGDVNNDGINDIIAGASKSDICTGGNDNCGGAQVWKGYDSASGGSFSSAYDYYLKGVNNSDEAGKSAASCDVNNDTVKDIILGAYLAENDTGYSGAVCGGADCGSALVYFGISAGGAFNSTPDLELFGTNASDYAGFSVACGDVNNDTISDIIMGAPLADDNASSGQDKGAAVVYFGKTSGEAWNTTPDLELFGRNDSDWAGTSVAAGDVNNDGIEDILIGVPYADEAGQSTTQNKGSAAVYFGKTAGQIFNNSPDAELFGASAGDMLGAFSVAIGDVNNDGIIDVIASAPNAEGGCKNATASNCGSAVIYYGIISAGIDSTPNAELFGADENDGADPGLFDAGATAGIGDIDNDGIKDILLGGPQKSAPGETHLALNSSGVSIYYGINADRGETFSPIANIELFGRNESDFCTSLQAGIAADIDNDGFNEVIIGCHNAESDGQSSTNQMGSVQVFDPWNIYPSPLLLNITVMPETGNPAPCAAVGGPEVLVGSFEFDYTSCIRGLVSNNCNVHASQNCTLNITIEGYNGTIKLYPSIEYTGFWWNITNSSANNIIDTVNYWINVTPFVSTTTTANATYTQRNFTIDHTPPHTITLNAFANNSGSKTTGTSISLNWTAADNLGMNLTCDISISPNTTNWTSTGNIPCISGSLCNRIITGAISENRYYWNVSCNDTAGNLNRSITWTFTIDRTNATITEQNVTARDPSLRIINWSNSVDVGTTISFRAIVSDALSGVSAVWVRIWKTTKEAGILLWEGFMRLISGTVFGGVWEVNWTTNASLPSGIANYTIYVNDTANNTLEYESNFSVNYKPEQGNPIITSNFYNTTYGNLTCSNASTTDADGDAVVNVFDWRLNGTSDAVLNMPFEGDRNNTQAKDYSSYGRNGTHNGSLSEMPRWNASCGIFAGSGGCYEFDGINDSIKILSNLSLRNTGITISLWTYIKSTSEKGSFIKIGTTGGYALGIGGSNFENTGNDLIGLFENVRWIDTNNATGTGWQFVAMTLNSSGTPFMYLNGTLINSYAGSNANSPQAETDIGGYVIAGGNPRFFNGSIDQVRIYNRTLSSAEIASLYNAGSPQYNKVERSALSYGQNWSCAVTPNDRLTDGNVSVSGSLVIAAQNVTINLTSPLDSWYVNSTAKFECSASVPQIGLVNVSLWHNNTGTWARNATVSTIANSSVAHFTVTGLATNNFVWTCQACESVHECFFAAINRTLMVDVLNPDISFHASSETNATKKTSYNNFAYINTTLNDTSNNMSAFIDWNKSLVGWWRLEEGNGTFFVDSSTWGNNGTCTACPNLTTGMRGKAYAFDGSNDGVIVPDDSTFEFLNNSFTLEAWVYPKSSAAATKAILEKKVNDGNQGFLINQYGTRLLYYINSSGPKLDALSFFSIDAWNHLVITHDSSSWNITAYSNGVPKVSAINPWNISNTNALGIGIYGVGGNNPFNGTIDEVKIWSRTLSIEEIQASYSSGINKLYRNFTSLSSGTYTYKAYVVDQAGNLNNTEERTFIVNTAPSVSSVIVNSTSGTNLTTENLTAYVTSTDADSDAYTLIYDWRKNGISDAVLNMPFDINGSNVDTSNVKDYSSFSNNGSATGGIRWNSSCGTFTGSGGCYEFDGNGDYLLVKDANSLDITDALTIEAWVKTNSLNTVQGIAAKTATIWGNVTFATRINSLQYEFITSDNGTDINTLATGSIVDTNWHHLVFWLNGSRKKIYVDGQERASGAWNYNLYTNTQNVSIGIYAWAYPQYAMNGSIDQARIYNRSLSSSEISMLYNSGIGMYNRTHSDATAAGDVWYAVVTPADIYEDGTPVASNNITINTPPPKVTIAEPTHGNVTMTNRSINFRWLSVADTDGDSVSYNLSIKCYATAGGSCSPSDDREYNTTAVSFNLTEATELRYLSDDNYFYNWSITAYDGRQYGDSSNWSNFSILGEIIIDLINDTINFTSKNIGDLDNTTDFSPQPITIENKGNNIITVNLSSAKRLFSSGSFPGTSYRIRVNDTPNYLNAFSNNASSQISWTNVPIVNQTLLDRFNYSTGNDRADIHIHIEVPNDELAGSKSSILTLTGWYAL